MQNLPIYLYNNSIDVILDLDPTTRGVHRVMYQHDLKIQKGVKNKVRIQFKNSDQKRIHVANTGTYVFSMFDATNQRVLIEKKLDVLDQATTSTRGLAELTLNASDTLDLPVSDYQFTVKYQDPSDGDYLPAYANTYYGMAGQIKLSQDAYPVLQPSQQITSFLPTYNDDLELYQHASGDVYAYPEYNGNTALHTMALYMNLYRGTVYIQGTLYNSPAGTQRYCNIVSRTYSLFSGIDYFNFNGVFSYVRVIHQPAVKPGENNNNNPSYYGSFDKVLYRC